MCNFSGRLVAWMDGELAEYESAEVERHVAACGACRECVSVYENASHDFAGYYDASTLTALATKLRRRLRRWAPVVAAGAAVAAALFLALLPRPADKVPTKLPSAQQVAIAHPPVTIEPPTKPLMPVHRAHIATRHKATNANWAMAEPAIQIAIPADAMFPPGAVPEGATYVANLSLTDGSVQGIRLQP